MSTNNSRRTHGVPNGRYGGGTHRRGDGVRRVTREEGDEEVGVPPEDPVGKGE